VSQACKILILPIRATCPAHNGHSHLGAPPRPTLTSVPHAPANQCRLCSADHDPQSCLHNASPQKTLVSNFATCRHVSFGLLSNHKLLNTAPLLASLHHHRHPISNKTVFLPAKEIPGSTDPKYITVRGSRRDLRLECSSIRMRNIVATTQTENIRSKTAQYMFTRSPIHTPDVFTMCTTACCLYLIWTVFSIAYSLFCTVL
jgi:hypothetical protein